MTFLLVCMLIGLLISALIVLYAYEFRSKPKKRKFHICQYCGNPVKPPLAYHEGREDCIAQAETISIDSIFSERPPFYK